MRTALLTLAAAAALVATGCDTTDTDAPGLTATLSAANVPADPYTSIGADGRPTGTTGRFTLYSLRENRIVPNSDSASTKWDLGFRGATILANQTAGAQGGILVRKGAFSELAVAPDTAYAASVSGAQWYTYTGGVALPTPGRTLVVKTADGKYAKVSILSYYRDKNTSVATTDVTASRYYSFEYVLQQDGTRAFQ